MEVLGIALLLAGFIAGLDGLLILKILRMDIERSKPMDGGSSPEEQVGLESGSLKA